MSDHLKYLDYLHGRQDSIRTLTDQLPVGIYRTSVDGKILYANPALAKMLGYSIDELYELSVNDLYYNPSERDLEIVSLVNNPKDKTSKTILLKTKNGKKIFVKDTVNVIKDNNKILYFDGVLEDITAQVEAENALKESETRYKILTDIAIEGIIIHDGGTIVDINPSAEKISGYKANEVIGRSILNFVHKESQDYVRSILNTDFSGIFETQIVCADKKVLITEIEANNVIINEKKHSVVAFRDITKRKKTEEDILSLSWVVKQSPVSIVITNLDGKIEYVNPKFCEVTGYSFEEAIGENPRILKSEHTKSEDYKDLWETISKGGTWRGEFLNKRKDGTIYWELASVSPVIDESGRTIKYLAVKEDITDRKQTEEALIESEKELSQANATKNMFFSIMAHDLKGPIGSFLQLLNLLKTNFNDISNDEKLDYVNILIGLSTKTNNLLKDLLLWARIQMNTIDFSLEKINLKSLIENPIKLIEEKALDKNIKIINDVSSDIEVIVDSDSVRTIIRNLLSNAIKFSHKNSEITIGACINSDDNFVEVFVKDSGIGIPKENIDKLFKIETAFSTYGTEKEKGTGLGLILCKELMSKNKGSIYATSTENKGATFTITLKIP